MNTQAKWGIALAVLVGVADVGLSAAQAQDTTHHSARHRRTATITDVSDGDRPLTINPRRRHSFGNLGQANNGPVVQVGPNEIYAPGGFKLPGRPLNFQERQEVRKEARNQFIRRATSGIYGYGIDGLGGFGFDNDSEVGYDNPNYGGSFNTYTGYNGVPSNLAFGPSYAFRYVTDHDPEDDDTERGHPPAAPGSEPSNPFDIDN
ncbi:hypothetical protein [Lichenihabitans psoromatis]|uniref:hypothetical protein n=1 Tax=Lichenihabitans psoromatis TaxID=2528642 RepID=UPI0010360902|nr:hypothetical protein [Lichenihabitans psoromatis]